MAHRYRIREIAQQADLSLATVDRALHRRPGIRQSTIAEVEQAIVELDRQQSQLRIGGRLFLIDLVMHAPMRFSSAVRRSLEAELPFLRPAVIRSRFHLAEEGAPDDIAAVLDGIGHRGSQGVILKAHDHPVVVEAIDTLVNRGIPVVTLATDLPMSRRLAYVGIDNRVAGATAAYLLTGWGETRPGSVLLTLSSSAFRAEQEREMGFRAVVRDLVSDSVVQAAVENDGLDDRMLTTVHEMLRAHPKIDSVYSIGGGNHATLRAFGECGRRVRAFVAHDLDDDNTMLLRQKKVSFVLHHDLRSDMRHACHAIMQAHGVLSGAPHTIPSFVQIVTPFNAPTSVRSHR